MDTYPLVYRDGSLLWVNIDLKDYLAKHPNAVVVTTMRPSMTTLEEWVADGVAEATDGCAVEPDGTCSHGHPSWLVALGMI